MPPYGNANMNNLEPKSWSGSYTDEEKERIKSDLDKVLGPEFISSRPAAGGKAVQYIEGWKALNLANQIFGYNGWSSEVRETKVDYVDEHRTAGKIDIGVSIIVRITLKDGTYHEDIGYGHIENARSKAMAFEKCKKEAMTDGMKRALRCFGNSLGNCLYDKAYLQKINKVKAPPMEFDESQLMRHPDIARRLPKTTPIPSTNIPPNPQAMVPIPPQIATSGYNSNSTSNPVSNNLPKNNPVKPQGRAYTVPDATPQPQNNNWAPAGTNNNPTYDTPLNRLPGIMDSGNSNIDSPTLNRFPTIINKEKSSPLNSRKASISDTDFTFDSPTINNQEADKVDDMDDDSYLFSDDVINGLDEYDLVLMTNKTPVYKQVVSQEANIGSTSSASNSVLQSHNSSSIHGTNQNTPEIPLTTATSSLTGSNQNNNNNSVANKSSLGNTPVNSNQNTTPINNVNQSIISINPSTNMNNNTNKTNPNENQVSTAPIGFYSASVAEAIQKNSPVPVDKVFNPKNTSTFLKTSLDHSRSTPIKRASAPPMAGPNSISAPRTLGQKRTVGMPPSYKNGGPHAKRFQK